MIIPGADFSGVVGLAKFFYKGAQKCMGPTEHGTKNVLTLTNAGQNEIVQVNAQNLTINVQNLNLINHNSQTTHQAAENISNIPPEVLERANSAVGSFPTIAHCDAAEPWQLGSQDAATPMMQGIIDLHHDIFFFLILIFVFVSWILVRALWHFHYKKNPIPQRIVHGTTIEILWTIFPSIILMFIAIPSFALLYSMDEVVVDPAITIKAIGHQWYWTYEYSDYNSSDEQSLTFDSYTIPEDDPELGQSRLLEVDNRVVVPEKSHLRIIVTPADVPHSWAVPSLGVKCDAVPGRLNQTSISVQREGVYYGQCSEICGTNHAFMRAPGNIGRLLSPLWLSRTTQGASHPRSKLLQRAAGAVWSRGARQ